MAPAAPVQGAEFPLVAVALLHRGADFVIFALESSGAVRTRLFPGNPGGCRLSEQWSWGEALVRKPSGEVPSRSAGYAPATHVR